MYSTVGSILLQGFLDLLFRKTLGFIDVKMLESLLGGDEK